MIIKLHNNKEINIKFYNARNITLECDDLIKIDKQDKTIIRLNFSDGFYIEIGDLLPLLHTNNSKFLHKVEIIKKSDNNKYIIKSEEINKTSHWLLPFVALNEDIVGYDTFLKNAYYFTNNDYYKFYEGKCIFLKYNYIKDEDLFFQNLSNLTNCTDVNTKHSKFEFVYTLHISEKWKKDIELLLKGAYSKISDTAKNRILTFHNLKKKGVTGCILYKDLNYMGVLQKKFNVTCDIPELEAKFTENINLETLK